jgi:hypothetical protein
MKNILIATLLILSFGACSTGEKKIAFPATISKDLVFPYGVYHHDVELEIKGNGETDPSKRIPTQNYHFKGIVQITADSIQIVALSPFGTTVFKIMDDLVTGKLHDEVYLARMKPFEPKLIDYYTSLKKLLTAKKIGASEPQFIKLPNDTMITFDKYDSKNIPAIVHIDSKTFTVKIEVESYDL